MLLELRGRRSPEHVAALQMEMGCEEHLLSVRPGMGPWEKKGQFSTIEPGVGRKEAIHKHVAAIEKEDITLNMLPTLGQAVLSWII